MTLNKFIPGVNTSFSSELNANFELGINDTIITKIDQLIDRDVTRPNDKVSPFVEAYVDADGRKNSVDTANTTAALDNTNLKRITTIDLTCSGTVTESGFTNPNYAFDYSDSSYASSTGNAGFFLGRIFTANKYISTIRMVFYGTSNTITGKLQSYNGSTWSDLGINANVGNTITTVVYTIDTTCQGIRWIQANDDSLRINEMEIFGAVSQETEIIHTIPSGTFNSDVSSGTVAVKIVDWEDGASLQWKAQSYVSDGIDDTIDKSANPWSSSAAAGNQGDCGIKILAKQNCYVKSCTFRPGTGFNGQVCYVRLDSTDEIIGSATISSNSCTFSPAVPLLAGNTYKVESNVGAFAIYYTTGIWVIGDSNADIEYTGYINPRIGAVSEFATITTQTASLDADTGYQDFNIDGDTAYCKISSFTAFTSEPTSFIVKLVPKTTSPTAGVPSISGAGIKLL